MQRPKSILLLIIFISIMLITFIITARSPLFKDRLKKDDPIDDQPIDMEDSLDVNSAPEDRCNGFIATPPILFDKDIEEHLYSFRTKVDTLTKSYPNALITCKSTSERIVALTFDDGPDNITTPQIVDILDSYNVPATFFFLGKNMESYPDICQKVLSSGHQVANHSFSHARPTDISVKDLLNEFERCDRVLDRILGQRKEYVRPPYGLVTEEQLACLEDKDVKAILWSIDSMDWYTEDRDEIVKCVVDTIHPGAIVLMHSTGGSDNRKATVEALPTIIEALREQGYFFVTVERLLGK